MISYARQNPEQQSDIAPPPADDHIAPAPRVSVQAFCETVETAAAVQSAGEDRRLGKAHLKIQMGGMAAAIEAYRTAPTPNVIILETEGRNDILAGLDQLATVCDPGTRVVVIGRVNDVTLYRELVRRGVSDYVDRTGQYHSTWCVRFAACSRRPRQKPSAGSSPLSAPKAASARPPSRITSAWAIARDLALDSVVDRSRPRLRHRQPRLQQGSAAGHRQCVFSPDRLDTAFIDACCRNAPTISACWRAGTLDGSTISAPTPSIRSSIRCA